MDEDDNDDLCQACGEGATKACALVYRNGNLVFCESCDSYPKAVSLLVQRDDGMYLAVSRRNARDKFGLPGGKVDPGESMLEALAREVREETGLAISEPEPVFIGLCHGKVDYLDITYRADVAGTLHTDEPIDIAWVDRATLLAGPFGDYLGKLFRCLDA